MLIYVVADSEEVVLGSCKHLFGGFLDLLECIDGFGRCFVFICISRKQLLCNVSDCQLGPFR